MKTISKIVTVVFISPSLALAYMGVLGVQISIIQVTSAMVLVAMWFAYITNPFTNPLE